MTTAEQKSCLPSTDEAHEKASVQAAPSTTEAATKENAHITGFKLQLVFVSLTLVAFLMLLDVSIVATATPRITSDFHSLPDIGWYGSAYLLANCSLQPLAGKFYTYFHSKTIFLAFFALFQLGSLLCGVATSSKMLIISRAVAGMGAAGIMNGGLTIISVAVPLSKRPLYLGAMMGIAQIGVVAGPLLGGAFTEYTIWRWCFYINLPIGGVVAVILLLIRIPDNANPRQHSVFTTFRTELDLVGFALFAAAVIQLLLALQWGGNLYAWNSATCIGLFCGSAATVLVFLAWERRMGTSAMLPLSILKKQAVWSSCAFAFFFFAMLQLVAYYLPVYFQAIQNASPMLSGVDMLPSILAQLLGTVGSGVAVTKIGYYTPFAIACGLISSIGHGLLTLLQPNSPIGLWIGIQLVLGFGRGLGMQIPFIAIQNSLPLSLISISISLVTFSQTFGAAVMLSIAEAIFAISIRELIPKYAPDVSTPRIIDAGAGGLWNAVESATSFPAVLIAYNICIRRIYYLAVGCSALCFLSAWGLGWIDTRKKPEPVVDHDQS